MKKIKHIELFGFPGSGKTTISTLISENNKKISTKYRVESFFEINVFKLLYIILKYIKLLFFLFFSINTKMFSFNIKKYKQIIGFFIDLTIQLYFYEFTKKIFISQHGFIQITTQSDIIREYFIHNEKKLIFYLDNIPKKESLYIYLDVKKEISIKRDQERVIKIKKEVYEESEILFKMILEKLKVEMIKNNSNLNKTLQSILKIYK